MNRIRLALTALVILFLAACSSPDDFNPTGLEPQFGDSNDNMGLDVASPFAGRVYVLSKSEFYDSYYNEEYDYTVYSSYVGAILNRYDGSGKLLWSKEVADSYCDDDCDAHMDIFGVYADKGGYGYTLYEDNGEYTIAKSDSQGNVVRVIYLNSSTGGGTAANVKAAVDSSGNIYFARVNAEYDYDTYTYSYSNLISKYNTNGTLQWQRTSTVGAPTGIAVSSSGNIYVVGTKGYAKYTSSGNLSWTKTGSGNDIIVSGSYIYVRRGTAVLKYDGNGKQLWSKTQSGLSSPVYGEMTGDSAGNIYLSGKYAASSSNRNGFVRKLNASGSVLWTKTFGTSAYDDVRGITSVSGSEIYITGETQGSFAHTNRGGQDGYIRELNSSGNPVWTK